MKDSQKPIDIDESERTQAPDASAEAAPQAGQTETAGADAPAESELEALRRQVSELKDQNLRLVAEARNQQQRTQREKTESIKYAESEFARELLVVLDDLERTRGAMEAGSDAKALADGLRMIQEHFLKVLGAHHIKPIESLRKPFDPNFHEALLQQPSNEHPAGTVMEEVARGYRMHERVLRPTQVIVSTGPAAEGAAREGKKKG